MPALSANRSLAPYTTPSGDLATRVAVSLSMLSWLGVTAALFLH